MIIKFSRLRTLCVKIYKCIKSINPSFINEIFTLRVINRAVRIQNRLNLDVPKINQVSLGNKSLRFFEPKIWNSVPLT